MAKLAKNLEPEISAETSSLNLAPAWQANLSSIRAIMCTLAQNPPQVILLEGGTEQERLGLAKFWACLQHCEMPMPFGTNNIFYPSSPTAAPPQESLMEPCGQCASCLQIGADIYIDVLSYDGRISNTQDEESPGPIRALTKDNAVEMKSRVADTTHSGNKRVVILNGIEIKRSSAANSLLKVLEEPSPTSIFVLLTPQREQLLPTLVSRSWVLTLPWPNTHTIAKSLDSWEQGLATFLRTGQQWWNLTAAKGAVDHNIATDIVLLCQKCLLHALAGKNSTSQLAQCFKSLSASQCQIVIQCLERAQEALLYNVNPARVLEALAAEIYTIYHSK